MRGVEARVWEGKNPESVAFGVFISLNIMNKPSVEQNTTWYPFVNYEHYPLFHDSTYPIYSN